jgi:hypothetical protein
MISILPERVGVSLSPEVTVNPNEHRYRNQIPEQIEALKSFLHQRAAWMDATLAKASGH